MLNSLCMYISLKSCFFGPLSAPFSWLLLFSFCLSTLFFFFWSFCKLDDVLVQWVKTLCWFADKWTLSASFCGILPVLSLGKTKQTLFFLLRSSICSICFFFNSLFLQLTFGIIVFLNPMIGSKGSKTAVTTEYNDCRSLTQDKIMETMFDLLQIE